MNDQVHIFGPQFDAIAAPMLDYLFNHPPAVPLVADSLKLRAYLQRLRERPSGEKVLIATSAT